MVYGCFMYRGSDGHVYPNRDHMVHRVSNTGIVAFYRESKLMSVCITGTVKFTDKVNMKLCRVEVKRLAHTDTISTAARMYSLMLIKLPSMDVIIPILQMRKLRLREVKWLSQCHSTKKISDSGTVRNQSFLEKGLIPNVG